MIFAREPRKMLSPRLLSRIKYESMDANRVIMSYRLTSAMPVFLLLILLGQHTPVFTVDTPRLTATIKIIPEYTTEPREGDNVTLDCEISSSQPPNSVQWTRRSSLDENTTTVNAEKRLSVSPLQVVNLTATLYSHKITIYPVRRSDDQGFYRCCVNISSMTIKSKEIDFLVYRRDEFPVCTPDGPATVTIGSSLSCKTLSDTRTPRVSVMGMPTSTNDGLVTNPTHAGGSPGQEFIRTVTKSEHGKTFQCFSIPVSNMSAMGPACNIGPLTVVNTASQETPVYTTTNYTAPDEQQSAGLSGADIAGIVVGVILLLIIIAVHTLCCRCNPKRWVYYKSYPFNTGTIERDRDVLTQPDVEMRNSEPQTGNLCSSIQGSAENGIVTDTEDLISEQPHLTSTDPKPKPPAIYAQVNKTTPETDSKKSTEPKQPPVHAQVNKTIPKTDLSKPIDAQMDAKAPQGDEELLKENSKGSSKLQKIKNIKRFGQNRIGQVSRPPNHEPVIIYADLDLPETGDYEFRRPPSDDLQTVYAEIMF